MKKSTKLISLILAVVMIFSASCFSAAASAIPTAAQGSIEQLIQNKNLAELVGWLVTNLNAAKGDIAGTVLRLVYEFAGKNIGGEGKDTFHMSDEQLAKTLLDWLDANLPEWTKDITEQSWWGTVQSIVKLLSIDLDLKSVDGIVGTVYDVCEACNRPLVGAAVGDLKGLNGAALKGVKRSGGNLNVIYALLQWINDNQQFIKKFVIGGISDSGIKLGGAVMDIIGGNLDDINTIVRNIPDFAKGWVYLLVDGYAEKPDIQKNPKGGWGVSPYAAYSADEMLAAALISLINDTYKKSADAELVMVSQEDCREALNTSFYGLLAKYGKSLYTRFAVGALNNNLKDLIGKLKDYPEAAKAFNLDYNFTDASFDAAFADANATGFLGQFNNILGIIFKTMLSADAYKAIAFENGGNDKLNGNLTRACRYVLPILATYSANLGFDFTKFTAEAVQNMELPEMAVAVLKIFFPTWFKTAFNAEPDLLKNAETLAQLGAVTMKYVVMNQDLLDWFHNGFNVADLTAEITADKIAGLSDAKCIDLACGIGAKLGAYALDQQKDITHFTLANAKADWTWKDYCDEIVDWAIGFIKGLPAVMVKHVSAKPGEYDGFGPFYKLNVALNELIDFAMLSDVNDETFKLDTETLIFDTIAKNLLNFDVAAILHIFEVNHKEGNVLDGKVIPGVIGIVDRILTALFSHTCGASKDFTKELDCTHAISGTYDVKNGHYNGTPATKEIDTHDFVEDTERYAAPTCVDLGTKYFVCTKCGTEKTENEPATGVHEYEFSETVTLDGQAYDIYVCKVCGKDDARPSEAGPKVPENLCDVDGNGKVESADARLALRASVGLEPTITEGTASFLAADVNGDKKVGSDDARLILRLSVKLENLDELKAKYAA